MKSKAKLVQPFLNDLFLCTVAPVSIQVESATSTKVNASFRGILCIF